MKFDGFSLEACPSALKVQCKAVKKHERLVNQIWPYLDACIYSFVPFVVITVLNSFIVKNITKAMKRRNILNKHAPSVVNTHSNNSANQAGQSKVKKADFMLIEPNKTAAEASASRNMKNHESSMRLSCMLITISISFLCMTMPVNVLLIVHSISGHHLNEQNWSKKSLALSITETLMYLNHSTNFFLYCATGKKFRKELKKMFQQFYSFITCANRNKRNNNVSAKKTRNSVLNIPTAHTFNSNIR